MLLFTSCLVPNRTMLPFAPIVLSVLRRGRFSHLTRADKSCTHDHDHHHVLWCVCCRFYLAVKVPPQVGILTRGLFPGGFALPLLSNLHCCPPADRSPTYTHKNDPVLYQVAADSNSNSLFPVILLSARPRLTSNRVCPMCFTSLPFRQWSVILPDALYPCQTPP